MSRHLFFRCVTTAWILGILLQVFTPALMATEIVAVLSSDAAPYRLAEEEFAKRMGKDGHTVRTLTLETLNMQGTAALRQAPYVLGIGTPAAVWLHDHQPPMPLIYCMVSSPERAGLLTPPPMLGITTDVPLAAQLALIREALPQAHSIGVLYRQADAQSRQDLEALKLALPEGLHLEAIAIDQEPTAAVAIDTLLARAVDVVWTGPDSAIWNEASVRSLLLTALRRKIPVFGYSTPFVRAGALLGVGLDPAAQGSQAADLLVAVMSGKITTTEPRVVPPSYEICLNLVVAQKLQVALPKPLQDRAAQLFGGGK